MLKIDEDTLYKVLEVPGGTGEDELVALAALASEVPSPLIIVEIGTMHGRSAMALAIGAGKDRVYSIECNPRPPFPPEGEFNFIRGRAADIARNWALSDKFENTKVPEGFEPGVFKGPEHKVGLLFIDDDHTTDDTIRSINAWMPLMARESVLAIHDIHMNEVKAALVAIPSEFKFEKQVGVIAVYRRKKQ